MKVRIVDNSGGLEARVIRVLHTKKGQIGDVVVVSLLKVAPHKPVKKGEIYKGVLVRSKQGVVRKDGTRLRFYENGVILLTKELLPVASRVIGPLPLELSKSPYLSQLTCLYL